MFQISFLRATIEASRHMVSKEATKFFTVNAFRNAYLKSRKLNLKTDVSLLCSTVYKCIYWNSFLLFQRTSRVKIYTETTLEKSLEKRPWVDKDLMMYTPPLKTPICLSWVMEVMEHLKSGIYFGFLIESTVKFTGHVLRSGEWYWCTLKRNIKAVQFRTWGQIVKLWLRCTDWFI